MENAVDDPFAGGGQTVIKVGSTANNLLPAPGGCRSEAVSSSVVRVFFTAPSADRSLYDGYKVYENTLGLRTTILDCCAVDIMGLQPNKRYYFYVVTYKGALESDPLLCNTWIVTPP